MSRTHWNDEEWNDFALMLDELFPDQKFMHSADLLHITAKHLNTAGALMKRPRHFVALTATREKLVEIFAELRKQEGTQEKKAEGSTAASAAADGHRFHRAPPPAEPPSPLKIGPHGEVPRERVAKPEPETINGDKLFETMAWTRAEWLAIATEIHRANPIANYPQRGNVAGLDTEDVALAQRVLPLERQIRHLKVVSFSQLRTQLEEAFGDLKKLHDLAKAGARTATTIPTTPQLAAKPPVQLAPAPATPQPAAPVNPYEAVFAPLVDLFIAKLRPVIAELLSQQQATAKAIQIPTAQPARSEDKPRKLHIGVIGNRNTYQDDLVREFPHLRITCIDTDREIESVKSCEKIFVMTKFVPHTTMGKLKHDKVMSEHYTMVNGGLSDLKRVIRGLFPAVLPIPQPDIRTVH
jgi:hypothetical protein